MNGQVPEIAGKLVCRTLNICYSGRAGSRGRPRSGGSTFTRGPARGARWEQDSASLTAFPTRVSGGALAAQRGQCQRALADRRGCYACMEAKPGTRIYKQTHGRTYVCNISSARKHFSHKFNDTKLPTIAQM